LTASKQIGVNVNSRKFIVSAGVVLSLTGIAKIWSGLGHARILVVPDPLFGIGLGNLLCLVGTAEVVIALVCFFRERQLLSIRLVAWLATMFTLYRLGLLWIGWHRPCSCLGNLTDAINVSPQAADNFMKGVLAYLLIGSYTAMFWHWSPPKMASAPESA
jgi:hypothetical protein